MNQRIRELDKVVDEIKGLKGKPPSAISKDDLIELRIRLSDCINSLVPDMIQWERSGTLPPEPKHGAQEVTRMIDVLGKLIKATSLPSIQLAKDLEAEGNSEFAKMIQSSNEKTVHDLLDSL